MHSLGCSLIESDAIGRVSAGLKGTPCGDSDDRDDDMESAGDMRLVAIESVGDTMLEDMYADGSAGILRACKP